MKSLRSSASIVMLMAGMFAAAPAARAADATQPTVAATPATTQPTDPRVTAALLKIQTASDPSAVVEDYAKARAIAPDSIEVGQAYVARLVKLGVPEMAESQARDLTQRAPDDGIAWAVVAYADARHDSMRAALEEIAIASTKAPSDPFVQRTAGQLLAYHDRRASEVAYPESLETSLADVRNALTGKPDFDGAYRASNQTYAQRPTTEPQTIGRYTYNPPSDIYDNGGSNTAYDNSYSGGYYSSGYYYNPYLYVVPSYGYYYSPFYSHSHFDDHFHHSDFHHDDFHNHFIHSGSGHDFNQGSNFGGSRDSGMIDRGQRYVGGGVNTHVGGMGGASGGFGGGGGGGMSSGARGGMGGGGGHR